MTRRIDPLLHKPVRLKLAQLVVNTHRVTLGRRRRIWLKRSIPTTCHGITPPLPQKNWSTAPASQLGEQ